MTERFEDEISAYLDRAERSLQAARELATGRFYDFAASRAYYAAFYAASALLLREGMEFSKHSGVIAAIHRYFVKTGKLAKEHGKALTWLFEVRGVGDYGGIAHVSRQEVEQALEAAEKFVGTVRALLS